MKVIIAFDADPSKIGTTRDVPADEARVLVREGRARYADSKTKKAETKRGGTSDQ